MRVTASNIVHAIGQLPRNIHFQYADASTRTRVFVARVDYPEGPILIGRYGTKKCPTPDRAEIISISNSMLWRLANAVTPNVPINLERVYGSSYNSRSALEALIIHTPLFYITKLDRLEQRGSTTQIKKGHKHLIFLPDKPHENGVMGKIDLDLQISELIVDAVYERIHLTPTPIPDGIDVEMQRRHAQIQIALVQIGKHLGYRTWVAANDRSIEYAGRRLSELDSVVDSLGSEKVLSAYPEAARAARLIDAIWFRNGRLMPAVLEIEHSTGILPGLTRMKNLFDTGPALRDVRWTIVAPDDQRARVFEFSNREQFAPLNTRFFPYSAVEELYSLCQRRKIRGITDEFLDAFMEDTQAA